MNQRVNQYFNKTIPILMQPQPLIQNEQEKTNALNVSTLICSFINNPTILIYNEFLKELVLMRNQSNKIFAEYRSDVEKQLFVMNKSFGVFLIITAFELLNPKTGIQEKIIHELGRYTVLNPEHPLLNYCLALSILLKGASYRNLPDSLYADCRKKSASFLGIHFLAKELIKYPENEEAWKSMGKAILTWPLVEFDQCKDASLIGQLIPGHNAWNKIELAAYCYAKSLNISPNPVIMTSFTSMFDSIQNQSKKKIIQDLFLHVFPKEASSIPSPNLSSSNTSIPEKSMKTKRIDDDSLVASNKISKSTSFKSPGSKEKTNLFQNGQTLFANPAMTKQGPVLVFNEDEVLHVIKILRSNNNVMDNCTHLARDLLEYFKTGCLPLIASSTTPSTLEDFDVITQTNWIKREKGGLYLGITKSIICRDETNFHDLPYDMEIPQTPGGTFMVDEPVLNLSSYTQPSAAYYEINLCLMQKVREHDQGVSFGLVNIGRCGKYADDPGHMLVYFANENQVWYCDGQYFNGTTNSNNGCIYDDISKKYGFAGQNRLGLNTFGGMVFYTPIGPKMPILEMELQPVKIESGM